MLTPKKLKYRRQFKRRKDVSIALRGNSIAFGTYALRSKTAGNISSRQIESARRAITHFIKRGGRIWIRIFPDKPITKKPPETRMGGGKGDIHEYVAPIGPGRVMFEMGGVSEDIAREALRLASHKLPVRSEIIVKESA